MIKSFFIGAVPISLFLYTGVFYPVVLFGIIMIGGLSFASYLIGEAVKEEFFNDPR
jgi:hypothetical protein